MGIAPSSTPTPVKNEKKNLADLFKDSEKTRLDLKGRNLYVVPDGITRLTNLQWLNMPNNHLTTLPDYFFTLTRLVSLRLLSNQLNDISPNICKLSNLTSLDVSKNQFTTLQEGIGNLVLLTELNFYWNKIAEVSVGICKLTNLKVLNLSLNQLKDLPDFSNITSLEHIDFSHNKLTSVPAACSGLHNLTNLNLSGNQLKLIDDKIQGLQSLRILDIQGNKLIQFPDLTPIGASLRILRIRYNCLTEIPPTISCLTALEELEMSQNQITKLPKIGFGSLGKLHNIYMFNNLITELPDDIDGMVGLKELGCAFNLIEALPLNLGLLPNLVNVIANNNRIKELDETMLYRLTSVHELILQNNYIKKVPDTIGNLISLRRIDLSRNKIKVFPEFDHKIQTNLSWLELGANRLKTISPSVTMLNLVVLNLFGNVLTEIPKEIGNLLNLKKLYLSYNRLSTLPTACENLSRLVELFLGGNQFYDVPECIFQMQSLVELSFSNNYLSQLPIGISALQNLKTINLNCNNIKSLANSGLLMITNLTELDLSHNELSFLPDEFGRLVNMTDIDVSGNLLTEFPESFEQNCFDMHQVKAAFNKFTRVPRFYRFDPKLPDIKKEAFVSIFGNNQSKKSRKTKPLKRENETTDDISPSTSPTSSISEPRKIESSPSILSEIVSSPSKKTQKSKLKTFSTKIQIVDLPDLSYRMFVGWSETRGRRPDMQDTISIFTNFKGSYSRTLFCCFDGHSGERSAQLASQRIAKVLSSHWDDEEKFASKTKKNAMGNSLPFEEKWIISAFNRTFYEIHSEIEREKLDDGTAALVVLADFENKRLIVANAGDQRAIIARKDSIVQLTNDHKPDEPLEKDRIESMGGFVNEQRRVNGILALSRSLGDADLQPFVTYLPDVDFVYLNEGDRFVIIACDGVWDVLSNEQAANIVERVGGDPVRAAAAIRDYAHQLGSNDNISVIVFRLDVNYPPNEFVHTTPVLKNMELASTEETFEDKHSILHPTKTDDVIDDTDIEKQNTQSDTSLESKPQTLSKSEPEELESEPPIESQPPTSSIIENPHANIKHDEDISEDIHIKDTHIHIPTSPAPDDSSSQDTPKSDPSDSSNTPNTPTTNDPTHNHNQ